MYIQIYKDSMNKIEERLKNEKTRPTYTGNEVFKRKSIPSEQRSVKYSQSKSFFGNQTTNLCTEFQSNSQIQKSNLLHSSKKNIVTKSKKNFNQDTKNTTKKINDKTEIKTKTNFIQQTKHKVSVKNDSKNQKIIQLTSKVLQLQQKNQILQQKIFDLENTISISEKKYLTLSVEFGELSKQHSQISEKYDKLYSQHKKNLRRKMASFNEDGFAVIHQKQLQKKVLQLEQKLKQQQCELINLQRQKTQMKLNDSFNEMRGSMLRTQCELQMLDSCLRVQVFEDGTKEHSTIIDNKEKRESKFFNQAEFLAIAREEYNKKINDIEGVYKKLSLDYQKIINNQRKQISELGQDYTELVEKIPQGKLSIQMSKQELNLKQMKNHFDRILKQKSLKISQLEQKIEQKQGQIIRMKQQLQISLIKSTENSELFQLNLINVGQNRTLKKLQEQLQKQKQRNENLRLNLQMKEELIKAFSMKKSVLKVLK